MKLKKLEVFSPEELQEVKDTTLDLLEQVGVNVESPEARELLVKSGCTIEKGSTWVKFPRKLVLEQLGYVPDHFTIHGSDGSYTRTITTDTTHFATIGTPVRIYDPEKKSKSRVSRLEDTIKQIRIVDASKHIVASHVDVWPDDVPYLELHWHVIRAWAQNSIKPYGLGVYGRTASKDMMELVSYVVGGKEELIKNPRLIGFFNTTSPFLLPQIMTNGMEVFAKHKQPIIVAPCMAAGTTAPVTIAGLLTQSNLEILASITLAQLYGRGTPILFGSVSSPMDLQTGNVAWGAVETGLITAGIAQLARSYNIPSRCPGLITDSKTFDIQNGYERMMTLMFAVQAGINYITCAGTYEASLSEALELLVIDDDLIGAMKRGMEGVNASSDAIAAEVIRNVARSGKDYLRERHTIKNMRKEIYVSKLADRDRRQRWKKNGSKDIMIRARERVDEILATQKGPGLTPEVEQKFQDYLADVIQKRTMEDFRMLEGMGGDSETPNTPSGIEN